MSWVPLGPRKDQGCDGLGSLSRFGRITIRKKKARKRLTDDKLIRESFRAGSRRLSVPRRSCCPLPGLCLSPSPRPRGGPISLTAELCRGGAGGTDHRSFPGSAGLPIPELRSLGGQDSAACGCPAVGPGSGVWVPESGVWVQGPGSRVWGLGPGPGQGCTRRPGQQGAVCAS